MYSGKLVKKNGKLVYADPKEKIAYKIFMDKLKEGQTVDMFIDISNDNHSLPQLAKVHACIRELAKESGYTFEEMKQVVKERSGLTSQTDEGLVFKSFADCSKDEIALAIEACIEIGRFYNLNL
jgi:hypothetical protein